MGRVTTVPTIFSAIDRVTAPMRDMEKAVSRFAFRSEAAIARSNRKFRALAATSFDVGRKAAVVGAAIVAPLALAANSAIKFEDKMADVSKVLGLKNGSQELTVVADQVKKASVYLGVSAEEAASLYAELASGGVVISDLDKVAQIAGQIGIAFDLTAGQAGEAFIKMKNAMGATVDETKRVADSINFLSDNAASKAAEILDFMAQGGSGTGRILNIAGKDMASLGSTFISLGISASESATTIERFQKGLLNPNLAASKTFNKSGGGIEGLLAVLKEGTSKKSAQEVNAYFQQFGQYGTKIMLLAQTMNDEKGLLNALRSVADETQFAGSVQKEFENRQNTTAGKIKKLKAEVGILGIELGSALLPAIQALVHEIVPVIQGFSDWARNNKETLTTIMKVTAAVGAFAFAVSGVAFAVGIYSKAMLAWNVITKGMIFVTQALAAAQAAMNAMIAISPLGAFILVAIAAATAVYALTSAFGENSMAAQVNSDIQKAVIDKTVDQRIEIDRLFRQLRVATEGSKLHNETLARLNQIMPGVVDKYGLATKATAKYDEAQRELIKTIEKVARAEATKELFSQNTKELLTAELDIESKRNAGLFTQFTEGVKTALGMSSYSKIGDLRKRQQVLQDKVVESEMSESQPVNPSSGNGGQNQSFQLDVGLKDPRLVPIMASPGVNVTTPRSTQR